MLFRQHDLDFFLQGCPRTISWDNNAQENLYPVLSLKLQTTMHWKKPCLMLSLCSWDDIDIA